MYILSKSLNKQNVHHLPQIWGFITVIVVLLIGYITRYNYRDRLPKPMENTDLMHHSDAFNAERAWKDLNIITSFGPRPTGAYSNEVLAVDFLKREISFIIQMANKKQRIEMDVQIVSGAFWADFKPHGMTSVYRNAQNVVVKLHGQNNNNSLMLNCHFDSVAGSPGASDDAASCCVMLEILRVLSRRNYINKHSITFLFNGAEETGLQAAHGFITQHRWAKDIKAFINLESVGSAGKELLFQSGPNHSWLTKLYGKVVPYPNAQVAAEEVFQSGLIPSDTDFRIFRDFGNIPGVDLAHVINGYRYHTKFDHIDYISQSVLQHTGNNILELTKSYANADELQYTKKYSDSSSNVYFDILGLYFVSYSKEFANIFNYVIVTLSIALPYFFLSKVTRGINRKYIRYEIFLGFLINMICLVGSNAVCYAIAYELDRAGKSMSWYSNTIFTVTTYCVSTLATQCLIHIFFNRNHNSPISLALKVQARLNGTSLFWGLLTAAITLAGYRIGYVLMVPLLITLITNIIVGMCDLQNSIQKWLYIHLIGQIFVLLWTTHFYHMVLEVFIPTAGRSSGYKNPDIMIAIICCSLTFLITSYLAPLIILLKQTSHFFVTLVVIYIFSRGYFIGLTNHGFPYRDDSNGVPTIQRHFITHAVRTFYDWNGNIRYTDSGFWLRELDRNSAKMIDSLVTPELPISQDDSSFCKNEIFCGLPHHSCRSLHYGGFWVPSPPPLIRDVASLNLMEKTRIGKNIFRLKFNLTGSYHLSLQIRPKENVKLLKWNIMKNVPEPNNHLGQNAYFVMITHGLEAPPMNITLDLQSNSNAYEDALLDISLVTFHWEYHKEHTPTFANLLAKMPKWTFAVPTVAALRSWSF